MAVCYQCAEKGQGEVGARQWWQLLWPILLGMGLILALVLIVTR